MKIHIMEDKIQNTKVKDNVCPNLASASPVVVLPWALFRK